MKSALRRASTQPEAGEASHPDTVGAKHTSTTPLDGLRRPSLANISRRLGRSKKSQPTSTPPSTDDNHLGTLFISLPNELHALVLTFLDPTDILSLRLTSHATFSILNHCASTLLNTHFPQCLTHVRVSHVLSLHPPSLPNTSLNHHLVLLRRNALVTQTTNLLNAFMQMKIYMLPPSRQHPERITVLGTARTALLTQHLHPALWTADHYLSAYRNLLLHTHPSHTSRERSRFWRCVPCGQTLTETVAGYAPESLLPAYQAMRLLGIHLKASSRAPTYAGTIERALRRWTRRPAAEEELAIVMLLGGLDVMRRVTMLRGTYNSRLEIVRGFLEEVEEAVEARKLQQQQGKDQREKSRVGRMVVGKRGIERVELLEDATADRSTERVGAPDGLPLDHKGKGVDARPQANDTSSAPPETSRSISGDDDPIAALALPHHLLTEGVLDQIPLLEDILLPELRRRIEAEGLVDHLPEEDREEELETPFHWVRRVICGEEEGLKNENQSTQQDEEEPAHDAGIGVWDAAATQAAQAPQQPTPPQQGGRRGSGSPAMFGSMSRHMLVSLGRDD
ncbi:uncharacterized protein HMPREF1541_01614 [Cyphellophora europaea CBS 101466]|uniref:F-box domain-containing protein n=1 Tax=Cyphellophora europaea (strain CBS 101466) TaxID=1220924 RepID=W2S352_CYPE1|nr:uncharacterized protein HMPREF1541_01614 [Cyphellophora europaea CBS 101466]ETN42458.1 hypothetical protein HMPREF1541_01614 [Cyphellophora europaea CBS 101466]